jgi:predicted TIM-barrel fold metal-dependent hydrolase
MDLDDSVAIVSVDTHIGPRLVHDLRPYCPAKLLDEFDRFAAANDFSGALREILGDHPNLRTAGHYDSATRLADYDHDGVAAGVIFHGSLNLEAIPFVSMMPRDDSDLTLMAAGYQIYNRWLCDFVSQAPDRHIGLAQLPMWDIDASIAALKEAHDAGLRGLNFPAPREGVILEYNDRAWEPFWSACEERSVPLVTHVGGGSKANYSGPEMMALIAAETGSWFARRAVWWLIFGGVFERHPDLKLVITETPGNWWPYTAAELDSIHDMIGVRGRERFPEYAAQVPRKPSDYMATNVFFGASFAASFEVERAIADGTDSQMLWGSDYPHPEGTFLNPEDTEMPSVTRLSLRNTFCDIPTEKTSAILGGNAISLFGLDREVLAGIARDIGALTLGQLQEPIDAVPAGASAQAFRTSGPWT